MGWKTLMIIVVAILVVIYMLSKKNKKKDGDFQYGLDDKDYRNYVYETTQRDFKPYLQQILENIDKLDSIRRSYGSELNQQNYNAMIEIYNRANEIEKKIREYWNSQQFNKDFSYYISLHYSSHLLGAAIKQEQIHIKDTFVECKGNQKQWGDKIENLKRKQQRASGKQKYEISQQIADCCKAHKQISILASKIGELNARYHERVTQQFMETARRRDFIAENFGKRGQQWKNRMKKRALLRKKTAASSR